jgi:hypothetical protein
MIAEDAKAEGILIKSLADISLPPKSAWPELSNPVRESPNHLSGGSG